MKELPNGNVEIGFKRPLANGTFGIELTPMALMRRLASLVPPPGNHDTCYFGVFAANANLRKKLVRPRRKHPDDCRLHPGCDPPQERIATIPDEKLDPLFGRQELLAAEGPQTAYIGWAHLMKRAWGIDALACRCGGQRKLVRYVTNPEKIREGLASLGLSSTGTQVAKARPSPQAEMFERSPDADGVDPPSPDFVA